MSDSPEFVRVKHPVFGHFSTRSPEVWGAEVIDEDGADSNGDPLPAKPKVSVAKKATGKKNTPTTGAEPADPTPEEGSAS